MSKFDEFVSADNFSLVATTPIDMRNVDVPVAMEIIPIKGANMFPNPVSRADIDHFLNNLHWYGKSSRVKIDGSNGPISVPSHFQTLQTGAVEFPQEIGSTDAKEAPSTIDFAEWEKIRNLSDPARRRLCRFAQLAQIMCIDNLIPSQKDTADIFSGWKMFRHMGVDSSTVPPEGPVDVKAVKVDGSMKRRMIHINARMDLMPLIPLAGRLRNASYAKGFQSTQSANMSNLDAGDAETVDIVQKVNAIVLQQGLLPSILNTFRVLLMAEHIKKNGSMMGGKKYSNSLINEIRTSMDGWDANLLNQTENGGSMFCVRAYVLMDKAIGGSGRHGSKDATLAGASTAVHDALKLAATMQNAHLWKHNQSVKIEHVVKMFNAVNVLVADYLIVVVNRPSTQYSPSGTIRIYGRFVERAPSYMQSIINVITKTEGLSDPRNSYEMYATDVSSTFPTTSYISFDAATFPHERFNMQVTILKPGQQSRPTVPLSAQCKSITGALFGNVPRITNVREVLEGGNYEKEIRDEILRFFKDIRLPRPYASALDVGLGEEQPHYNALDFLVAFQVGRVAPAVMEQVAESIRSRINQDRDSYESLSVPDTIIGDIFGAGSAELQLVFWKVFILEHNASNMTGTINKGVVVSPSDIRSLESLDLVSYPPAKRSRDAVGGGTAYVRLRDKFRSRYAIHFTYMWVGFMLRRYKPHIDRLQASFETSLDVEYDESVTTIIHQNAQIYFPSYVHMAPRHVELEIAMFDIKVLAPIAACIRNERSNAAAAGERTDKIDLNSLIDLIRLYVLQCAHSTISDTVDFVSRLKSVHETLKTTLPITRPTPYTKTPGNDGSNVLTNQYDMQRVLTILRNQGTFNMFPNSQPKISADDKEFLEDVFVKHGVPFVWGYEGAVESFFRMINKANQSNYGNANAHPDINIQAVRAKFVQWGQENLRIAYQGVYGIVSKAGGTTHQNLLSDLAGMTFHFLYMYIPLNGADMRVFLDSILVPIKDPALAPANAKFVTSKDATNKWYVADSDINAHMHDWIGLVVSILHMLATYSTNEISGPNTDSAPPPKTIWYLLLQAIGKNHPNFQFKMKIGTVKGAKGPQSDNADDFTPRTIKSSDASSWTSRLKSTFSSMTAPLYDAAALVTAGINSIE